MNKIAIRISLIILIALIFVSCTSKKEKVYTIGFSQCVTNSSWRKQMIHEMKVEASFHKNIKLIIEDAQGNNDLQIRQIQGLMDKKVDLLIISPNESKPITPIAEKAFDQGIPTILLNREIDSKKYTSYIGVDNYLIGKMAANFLNNLAKTHLRVLEVWGLEGSSPAQKRHKGFRDFIVSKPKLKVVGEIRGNWLTNEAYLHTKALPYLGQIQAVFAHNDEMALGVYQACKEKKVDTGKMIFIGVNGLPGKDGGIQAVIDKKLKATFIYPTGGGKAIQVALDILDKKSFRKECLLNTALVDISNAEIIKQQSLQINDYFSKVESQLKMLDYIETKYHGQKTLFYVSVVLLSLTLILTVLLFFEYRNLKRTNQELHQKNIEISQQREELSHQHEQLKMMNERIEEVTAQKLRFFTNISHELRTPLSLLISPVEHILEMNKYPDIYRELVVMKNNIDRMLRMIGQLLDFRRLEVNEMKLYVRRLNIVSMVRVAKTAFNYQASTNQIDYSLTFPDEEIDIFCDEDKIEKVLLNLISNAFRFTQKMGEVHIELNDEPDRVSISITNSGKGMDPEQRAHIFNLINQEAEDYSQGTGIGLKMSKEYVEMHGGKIIVQSLPGEGSTFTFTLKKGREHFNPVETYFIQEADFIPEIKHFTPGVGGQAIPVELTPASKEYNVLIVEENDEMRDYLKVRLKPEYTVYLATSGDDAMQVLSFAEINLIICDAIMPDMDGSEFCMVVKSDLSISHIPIIMLTAQCEEEMKINALSPGADDYLYKPFNASQLLLKAKDLLLRRSQTQNYFRTEFFRNDSALGTDTSDKQFIQKVCVLLDQHINECELGVDNMRTALGLSRANLYRKIKEITGCSPGEFIIGYKVKKSLTLLAEKNLSIDEIASRCGFVSPAYFSECFKEVLGIAPLEYQGDQ